MASAETGLEANEWPVGAARRGWMASDLSLDNLSYVWTAGDAATLRRLVSRLRDDGVAPTAVGRTDFSDPALDRLMARLRRLVKEGPGLLFLRGLPDADYDVEDMRLLFAGLGAHFGQALSQSKYGDRMGEVTETKDRQASKRGYVTANALPFHTDHSEIFGLFCVQPAQEGGENVFVSSLKLYEVIQAERPDFIPILERGFRMWMSDEQQPGLDVVTPHHVPVFSTAGGLRSCLMAIDLAIPTADALGQPLTDRERAAVEFVISARERPELGFTAALGRGEAVFINNYEIIHARRPFKAWQDPPKPRHLLRLWLQDHPSRPLHPALPLYRHQNPSGLQGIDAIAPDRLQGQIDATRENPVSLRVLEALKNIG